MTIADDAAHDKSLTLGLRTLATLACCGPLDVARLARLHGSGEPDVEAVLAELERDGLVRRVAGRSLIAVTLRGAALTSSLPNSVH